MKFARTAHRRNIVAVGTVLAVLVGASASSAAPAKKTQGNRIGFSQFSSCEKFLAYIRPIALEQVGPYGFNTTYGGPRTTVKKSPTPSPSPPSTVAAAAPVAAAETASNASSSTNVQEAGVDEGDLVETDGKIVYAVIGNRVTITDTEAAKSLTPIQLTNTNGDAQLILDNKRLAVIANTFSNIGGETIVSVYDVTDPANLRRLHTTHLEGSVIATRAVGNRARLVISTSFGQRVAQNFPNPGNINSQEEADKATAANKKVIRQAPASNWLPRRFVERADGSQGPIETALPCGQVGRPSDSSGLGLTWVATVDLDLPNANPLVRGAAGVVASGSVTYASPDTLYVTTQQYYPRGRPTNVKVTTEVHAFNMLVADGAQWIASGRFTGTLLSQYSMSEHDGALRVAATRFDGGFGGTNESGVQNLMLDSKDRTKLKVVAERWGLGTNERIYAVRFVGPIGYVVTFRQVDPLYVLDLSDRLNPIVKGELKIPGYSAYLHPIADGLLIGVGQDATEQGRRTGTQVSLFDVADLSNPKRLATSPLGNETAAEYDPKAFLWWPASRDVFLPSMTFGPNSPNAQFGVVVTNVGDRTTPTLSRRGFISHTNKLTDGAGSTSPVTTVPPVPGAPTPAPVSPPIYLPPQPIIRTLIVSGKVVTVSYSGLMVSDLASLGEQRWVSFTNPGAA